MNNLEVLSIDDATSLEDYSELSHLTKLRYLSTGHSKLSNLASEDLSFIENLDSLEELRLYKCKVTSLNGIENLINLKKLDLTKSSIDNRDALKKLLI